MKTLCRALLLAASVFELSADDQMDPNMAVKALEDITSILLKASSQEIQVLGEVATQMENEVRAIPGYERAADYYGLFLENCGLVEGAR